MRKKIIILTLIVISIIKVSATEQISDLLIIVNDTFYLKTFPLENLRLKEKIKIDPFDYGEYGFVSTACYRGYVATWRVVDNKLLLIDVERDDSINEKLDILNYFKIIGYSPTLIDGHVYADWYSDTLKRYDYFSYYFNSERFYLSVDYLKEPDKKIELIFNKGLLISNLIISFDSYKKGDTLTKEISFYRQWFLKRGLTRVDAVIIDNNGKMVKVEIKDFGTTKRLALKEIKSMMGIKDNQEYWINPRYWDKKNKLKTPYNSFVYIG